MNAHHDYSAVLVVPSARELARRLPLALVGMILIGVSIGVSVRADLGLAPWDVFHKGLADRTGISFTVVLVGVGVLVMLAWIPLHQRPGVGTLINIVFVGPAAGLTLRLLGEPESLAVRIPMLLAALVGFGVGGGLYIGSALGPGPRDGLMTGLAARGIAVWKVRTVLETSVLVAGALLGGSVGVGTVVLAFGMGPVTHWALGRFHQPVPVSDIEAALRTGEVHGE